MAAFSGRSFIQGIQHLDSASQELFLRHGKTPDGRWSLVEQIVDDAMLRMIGDELRWDGHGSTKR